MISSSFRVLRGEEKGVGYDGYISENNFFAVLSIGENFSKEVCREFFKAVINDLANLEINKLEDFDEFISGKISRSNLPANLSLAAGYLHDRLLYLKTLGDGQIYLKRKNNFADLLKGSNSATGYIEVNDFFAFTTKRFTEFIGGENEIKKLLDHKNPDQITKDPPLDNISLFVLFSEKEPAYFTEEELNTKESFKVDLGETVKPVKPTFFMKARSLLILYKDKINRQANFRNNNQKKLTLVAIIVIVIILIWSAGFGLVRRKNAALKNQLDTARELITQKINQADDTAYINLPSSLASIADAKAELNKLKKITGNSYQKDIEAISKLIADEEAKLLKKEEKGFEEFYDLALENKRAKGDMISLAGDKLSILDKNGFIYSLSLSSKSFKKNNLSEAKDSLLLASFEDSQFLYISGLGVFKTEGGKLKKIVDNDKDWINVKDIKVYNGNLYLLDTGKDQVYKYLVADQGYSGKTSYFKSGQAISLKDAGSMAIDSSVYIGLNDSIIKFTVGDRDEFKTAFPETKINLTKIYTDKDTEKVYGWDKNSGCLYILAKNGGYERQIKSGILNQGSDFVVYKNAAYILKGEKIYKLAID